jgi:hypothetical protein
MRSPGSLVPATISRLSPLHWILQMPRRCCRTPPAARGEQENSKGRPSVGQCWIVYVCARRRLSIHRAPKSHALCSPPTTQPLYPPPRACKVECLVDVCNVCHALHSAAALNVDEVNLGGDGGVEQEAIVPGQRGVCKHRNGISQGGEEGRVRGQGGVKQKAVVPAESGVCRQRGQGEGGVAEHTGGGSQEHTRVSAGPGGG